MTFEIFNNLIFEKWCFVSVFELRTVSNIDVTDRMKNKKKNFLKILAWSNLKKAEIRKVYSTHLHILNRVVHAYGLCFNAIY